MNSNQVMASSLDEVTGFKQKMFERTMALVAKKGSDYNRDQQQAGDTLFNIRVCELMGIVPTAERGILVRLSDKFMRLVSLVHPDREPANTDESVLDTISDIHNYIDYLGLLHSKRTHALREAKSKADAGVSEAMTPAAARIPATVTDQLKTRDKLEEWMDGILWELKANRALKPAVKRLQLKLAELSHPGSGKAGK